MSKDFFKVKKGLHIKPSDPSTLTDLEDGDIIVDSTDNQLKKYSEEDGEFATIAGSGGAVANFFSDFDKLTPTLDPLDQVSVADDAVVFLPIDDNKKSKKITYTAAGSALYQVAASADLEGAQGLMTIWIKTDVQGVTVSTTTDGAKQSTLSVLATGKWRQYEIPYVVGGTNQGLIVESANSGDVNIDEPFVGLAPAGYIQDVGQAQFVGSLNYSATNCFWANNTSSLDTFPVDANCDASNITGNVLAPTTKIPAVRIPNARTDGSYVVEYQGTLLTGTANNTVCRFVMNEGDASTSNGELVHVSNTGTSAFGRFSYIKGEFRFSTSGDKQVEIQSQTSSGTADCLVFGNDIGNTAKFTVKFYPDASSTIVAQDTELTAETANEFSASITSGGILESANYSDWLTCIPSSTPFTCTFKVGLFSNVPSCVAQTVDAAGIRVPIITALDTTTVTVGTYNNESAGGSSSRFDLHCSKQGADVNKSATIIGKFEQIEEVKADLTADEINSCELVLSTVSDTIVSSSAGCPSGMSIVNNGIGASSIVIPSGFYTEFPAVNCTGSNQNGSTGNFCYINNGAVSGSLTNIPLRIVNSSGTSVDNPRVSVTLSKQGADVNKSFVGAVIKESSISETKCQTKFLSANVTGTGIIPSLTFNNLDPSKNYSLHSRLGITHTTTSLNDKYTYINLTGVSSPLGSNHLRDSSTGAMWHQNVFNLPFFKPTATTINHNVGLIQNTNIIYGYATLCQLPDTVVDTEEF